MKSAEVFLIFALVPCTSGTTLNGLRFAFGSVATPSPSAPHVPGSRQPIIILVMKIERFAGHHHEAREALVLSIAGVTAIMLIANLMLMILY